MKRNYFLKTIGASDHLLSDDWTQTDPHLLSSVRFPKRPSSIKRGDFLVYYATGEQRIFAIGRAVGDGADAAHEIAPGEARWPYLLKIQVFLLIPKLALAPKWDSMGIESTSIMQKSHIEINQRQYEKAWEAIVKRTRLNDS
ncbi:MAG TPA: hypothetical protein PLE13_01285 [Solirubrobacterales bacterium]|nr:hypothetical protein [Solirubrobacterales bacterium]HNA43885.1 hypothetical protein [Solirubrobacterales bacterium]HNC93767.1 hypothetical protein [Solirubrobacterales bacterium]HNE77920.1 hypothetical protein [Solirubrobacterales bacterium]HNF82602.1 hypothetical protein [Solirubrobacterales bacterium]